MGDTMEAIKVGLSEAEILKPTIDIEFLAKTIVKAAKRIGTYNVRSCEPDITCDKAERYRVKKSGLLLLIREAAKVMLEYAENELETLNHYDNRND